MKKLLILVMILLSVNLVIAEQFGINNKGLPSLTIDYTTFSNVDETVTGNWNFTGNVSFENINTSGINQVNSSDHWDDLDDPSDINTADLTDDDTYVEVSGDSMTGNLEINDAGDNTSIILHSGDTNLNASLIFQEVSLNRWTLLFNGLNNNFYLWNDWSNSPAWMAKNTDNTMTFYNDTTIQGDVFPSSTLTYSLGSGASRWLKLWVQDINAENIEAYNLNLTDDLNVDGLINGENISEIANNLTDYWKSDGSSTATGDWDIGDYNLTTEKINISIMENKHNSSLGIWSNSSHFIIGNIEGLA